MLGCEVQRGEVIISREGLPRKEEIVAIIGLSGPVRGTVAMTFPVDTAIKMVNQLIGSETATVDENVMDAVAELVNIVAGGAKSKLNGNEAIPINLSLPTVVRGNNYSVESPSWAVWLDLPFISPLGLFNLRVTFESNQAKSS
jgi:chemotaxis protein CheX